ncbi:MAG: hypothetical protein AAFN92_06455 [Bacteroidota bacterium]
MLVYFDLSAIVAEVRVVDLVSGRTVATVEQPLSGTTPASLRKAVEDAAKEATRQIMLEVYDQRIGPQYSLRVKTPPIQGFSIGSGRSDNSRWQKLPLAKDGLYSTFKGKALGETITITPSEIISGRTYPDWRIKPTIDAKGAIVYQMKPYRLWGEVKGGVALLPGQPTAYGSMVFGLSFAKGLSLRAGLSRILIPRETSVEPIAGFPAAPRRWRSRIIAPLLGAGYEFRDLSLGVRYGIAGDFFFAPRLLGATGWLSLEKMPRLRLSLQYQSLTIDVEQRVFARYATMATVSTERTNLNFLAPGVSLFILLK